MKTELFLKPTEAWSVECVAFWFRKQGLADPIVLLLEKQEICGETLLNINDEKLEKIGVSILGQRERILRLVKELVMLTISFSAHAHTKTCQCQSFSQSQCESHQHSAT